MSGETPRLGRLLLRGLAPREIGGAIEGDLSEEFERDRSKHGIARARRDYWSNALGSVWPLLTFDVSWVRVPRMLGAALLAVPSVGAFSYLVGVGLGAAGVSAPGSSGALLVHIAIVIVVAPVVGYGTAWIARDGGVAACVLVGVVLVAPAIVALRNPGEPTWLLALWITLLPTATVAGGLWWRRSRARP